MAGRSVNGDEVEVPFKQITFQGLISVHICKNYVKEDVMGCSSLVMYLQQKKIITTIEFSSEACKKKEKEGKKSSSEK